MRSQNHESLGERDCLSFCYICFFWHLHDKAMRFYVVKGIMMFWLLKPRKPETKFVT